jgi:hypothetical protein
MKFNIALFLSYVTKVIAGCVPNVPGAAQTTYSGIENSQYEHSITVGTNGKWQVKNIETGETRLLTLEHIKPPVELPIRNFVSL